MVKLKLTSSGLQREKLPKYLPPVLHIISSLNKSYLSVCFHAIVLYTNSTTIIQGVLKKDRPKMSFFLFKTPCILQYKFSITNLHNTKLHPHELNIIVQAHDYV